MLLIGIWQWLHINRQMQDELNGHVVTDFLTGAMNRRGFIEKFELEIQRSSRYNTPFSLIWFDPDHFRLINDRYGHHQGDEVLRKTAQQVYSQIRKMDIFARMGGEESPDTSLEGGMDAAEKLRQAIAACAFDNNINVTASFGVGEYRQGDSAELVKACG